MCIVYSFHSLVDDKDIIMQDSKPVLHSIGQTDGQTGTIISVEVFIAYSVFQVPL